MAAVWLFLRYERGVEPLRYRSLLLPHRWPEFRVTLGTHYFAQAEESLRHGDYPRALHLLRSSLAKNPRHAGGRILLARLYEEARRPELAREVLAAGWTEHQDDPDYLRAYFGLLAAQQADDTRLQLAQARLASLRSPDPHLRFFLALHAAQAALACQHPDQAGKLVRQHALDEEPEGALLIARIELARGLPELALVRLVALTRAFPDHVPARRALTEHYRRLERTAEWEASTVVLLSMAPLAAAPRVEHLRVLHRRGDTERMQRHATEFLHLFRTDAGALIELAGFAAETGQPALAHRALALIPVVNPHHPTATLLCAEAALAAGAPAEALAMLDSLPSDTLRDASPIATARHGLRAAAAFMLHRDDEARLHLNQFLAAPDLPPDVLVTAAQRLLDVGADRPAQTILHQAIRRNPRHPEAHALLLEQAMASDDPAELTRLLDTYLHLRAPSRALLTQARDFLGSDRHLLHEPQVRTLAALDAALAATP